MKEQQLPVLRALTEAVKKNLRLDLKNIAFVCVQHLVDTTVDLFQSIIEVGALPDNIFILGKHYSQSLVATKGLLNLGVNIQPISIQNKLGEFSSIFNKDIEQMWKDTFEHIKKNNFIKSIIVLDDGGRGLISIPPEIVEKYAVIGVEQTSGGLLHSEINKLNFPIIQVALSAAKQKLESPIIAEAIAQQIQAYLPDKKKILLGVAGIGAIGQAVIDKLNYLNYPTFFYDANIKRHTSAIPVDSLHELIEKSDIIFGCTGIDILKEISFDDLTFDNKIFISCSSEDKEFLSLLTWLNGQNPRQSYDPIADIIFQTKNRKHCRILRGGFPINFYHEKEIEPANNIQLTRALLLGGIVQAIHLLQDYNCLRKNCRLKLDPHIQQYIACEWMPFASLKKIAPLLPHFKNIEWINENSKGELFISELLERSFSPSLQNTSI